MLSSIIAFTQSTTEGQRNLRDLCFQLLDSKDVRSLLEKVRLSSGGALSPINAYRSLNIRDTLIKERGKNTVATGL